MGLGGISLWQLLIILLIVACIFGFPKLRDIGSDLGGAIKGFRKAMSDTDAEPEAGDDKKKLDEPDADFVEARTEDQQADHNQHS